MLKELYFLDGPLAGKLLAVSGDWYIGRTYQCETHEPINFVKLYGDKVTPPKTIKHTYRLVAWVSQRVAHMKLERIG